MSGATITVEHVSRLFRLGAEEVWAVRDVSLAVSAGEFLALIGRSGSGKTTLLNLIAGLDRPTEGAITIDGARVDTFNEKELNELRRHKLGFIFQSFGLLPLLSAQENVELPLRIAGYKHTDRVKRARRVLELVGLGRRAEHRPYELSGGEQQRVAIARALATEPALMLADEPTGELDSATATAIFTLMREIARGEGITIITSTHDRLVMELADRIEELADGHLVTGQDRQVWRHVQTKERSPFAAPLPPAAEPGERPRLGDTRAIPRLSSLVGADTAIFQPPGQDEPAAPDAALPANAAPVTLAAAAPGERIAAIIEDETPGSEVAAPDVLAEEPPDDRMRWAPPGRR